MARGSEDGRICQDGSQGAKAKGESVMQDYRDAEIEALRREVKRLREIVDKARKIIEDHDAKHGIKNEA